MSFSKKRIGLFTRIMQFPTLICTLLDTCLDSLFDLDLRITCTWSLFCTKSKNDELKEKSGEDKSINGPMLIVIGEGTVPTLITSNLSSFVLMFTAFLKTLTTVPNNPSVEQVMFLCMPPMHLHVENIVGDSEGIGTINSF
jgi:hypothetical protein